MTNKLLTELHLELLSFKEGCRGSSESTLVKMPHCWKSHALAQIFILFIPDKQGIPNASPCEEDQRLGSTIAVNRNFEQVMHLDDPVSMVTVGS